MSKFFKEQLNYRVYYYIFRWLILIFLIFSLFWIYFFQLSFSYLFFLITLFLSLYFIITSFILRTKYITSEKLFFDLIIFSLFLLIFIHFSGGIKSYFLPFLFIPLMFALSFAEFLAFFIVLAIYLSYYFLMRLTTPLETSFSNLFFVIFVSYLINFIVLVMVRRRIRAVKEVERVKSEFISMVGHQLRTPISSTRWIIESLLEGDLGELSQNQKEYLNELYKSNEKLRKFLNELLNVIRLEEFSPKIDLIKINLKDLIKNIISRYNSLINTNKLFIDLKGEDVEIISDLNLLDLILDNLISNALRYSFENGKVLISIEKKKNNAQIMINDSGIGIPKNQQKKIFQKFFRAKNALKKDPEGTGLGLYLSKRAVEILDGNIWFVSQENRGTTFYLSLPLEKKS